MVITRASHARGHEFDPRLEYSFFVFGFLVLFGTTPERKNKITTHNYTTHTCTQKEDFTSGEVRTHALKRGPELESGALTTRPQMLV